MGDLIGDSTRLIYDIMHYLELKDILGLLMLIDFEKAFDSFFLANSPNSFDFHNIGLSFK